MSNLRRVARQRMGAASGIAAPLLAFTCILIAIASYPPFSWTNNALSDLGIVPGLTGPVFNFGLFAAGLLAFNFAVFGLFNYFGRSLVGKAGALVFAAATVALMAIGVFNEHFKPTHYLVSVAFFSIAPISLFILTLAFYLTRQRGMAVFTLAIGVFAASVWVLQFALNYVSNVAVPEFVSGLAVSVWAVVLGKKMLRVQGSV